MIARHWRGIARIAEADAYVDHLLRETFPALAELDGFLGGSILRREVPLGVEFLIVTTWRSLDAIRTFAGADVEAAVVPDVVRAMMEDFDATVRHYEVLV